MFYRFAPAMIILTVLLCFVLGICFLRLKNHRALQILGRILFSLSIACILLTIDFFAMLLFIFSTVHIGFALCILATVSLLLFLTIVCAVCHVLRKRAVYLTILILFDCCCLTVLGFGGYQWHLKQIPVISENSNLLADYAPYAEQSKIATLDEPSALTLTDDLPRLDGATALYPIYAAFAKAVYPKDALVQDPNVSAYLNCTKTTGAYRNIVTGAADIIFVAAPSSEQETFAVQEGVELIYTPIGKEAFVFFVNRKNPINALTLEEIKGIYSGEITNWSTLGARWLGEIKAFQRPNGSGSQSALLRLMQDTPLRKPQVEEVLDGMGTIIEKTADYKNHRNAIGYSFRFYATEMDSNAQIKLLAINGVSPTTEHIEDGSYPISSDFYAVTRSDASENTQRLLAWICSPQGQSIIRNTGYTPIHP